MALCGTVGRKEMSTFDAVEFLCLRMYPAKLVNQARVEMGEGKSREDAEAYIEKVEIYERGFRWKQNGGVRLEAFVSDGVWLGGLHETRRHQPFVAIGPENWEDEEELTFFKAASEVHSLIDKLRTIGDAEFGNKSRPSSGPS